MKALIIILSLILTALANVECSYGQSKSANVTVNIILHPIQTIAVNTSQKDVSLQYLNIEDYEQGVSATLDDHLSVTSTGGFQVNVASNQDNFTQLGSDKSIPVSDVLITAANGSDNDLSPIFDNVLLSTNPESLIRSGTGGMDLKYNVTYDNTAGGSDKYVNMTSEDTESIFTSEVTYTITSK